MMFLGHNGIKEIDTSDKQSQILDRMEKGILRESDNIY